MLAADKLQLQSALKQQATALKEKEFQLHHSNLMTVGTQAAVLAGLDITMLIEFAPAKNEEWEHEYRHVATWMKLIYYGIIVAAFCANMIVVSHTTALSVLGAGMALRGPDGSMMTATDGLYEERRSVFVTFGVGLACTVGSVLVAVWLLLPVPSALICWFIALVTCRTIYQNYRRVNARFDFDESETVDFRDLMEGPGGIRVMSNQDIWKRRRSPNSGPAKLTGDKYRKSKSMTVIPSQDEQDSDGEFEDVEMNPLVKQSDAVRRRPASRDASPTTAAARKIMMV